MPKSISANLKAHIQQTVTTLATCWELIRTDGKRFFFTSHDVDINFEGNIYLASSGFTRTAIQNDSSLAVDNLDIESLFDNLSITEDDLRAGFFDYAEIKVFLINWEDLDQGSLKIRRGRLGEVVATEQGIFRTELRGLTQQLSQKIGEVYQAECRVDLGDAKCQIQILPDLISRLTDYIVGDFVRVITDGVSPIGFNITNGGFNTGDLTGWTTNSGTPFVETSAVLTPQEGSHFLMGGTDTHYEIEQIVDISGILSTAKIDAGDYTFDVSGYAGLANSDTDDTARMLIQFLDVSDVFIGTAFDTGTFIPPSNSWLKKESLKIPVPVNTRKVLVRLRGNRVISATTVNASFDNISGSFIDLQEGWEIYENRIYECTTAGTTAATQPAYDTVIDNTTADGSAIFTARDAFMRSAEVDGVTDQSTFTITNFSEARAVNDYFNGGGLTFLGISDNAGITIEMRDWDQGTQTVTLFLPMHFEIQPGDKLRLFPGCDKRLTTCINKFDNVVNFRGEPFIPGTDALTRIPDASSF